MAKYTVRRYLKLLAPGTPLRAGLDRILLGRTGALVVLGNNAQVQALSSGGFQLGVDFTEQALRELAKMDGAIVLSNDLQRIVAAGVGLHAGHGLNYRNVQNIVAIKGMDELNIGHAIVSRAMFVGMERAVREMKLCLGGFA